MSKKPKKETVRFNTTTKAFLLSQICEGLDVAEICRKYPDKVPAAKTIYRKSIEDPKFAEEMNQAYSVLYMMRQAEFNHLSKVPASEAFPHLEFREAEAALKRRVDALKFELSKLAPILSRRYEQKPQQVEHKLDKTPQFVVLNYSEKGQNEVDITPKKGSIEHK